MQVYQWALSSNSPFTFLQTFSAWRLIFFFKKYILFVLSQYKNKAHCTYCSIGKFFCLFKWLLLLLKRLWYCFLPCSLALYSVRLLKGVVYGQFGLWSFSGLSEYLGACLITTGSKSWLLVDSSGDSSNNHWEGNSNPVWNGAMLTWFPEIGHTRQVDDINIGEISICA